MIFFQTALLLGYLYAHFINKFSNKKQLVLHLLLLFLAVLTLPILPDSAWEPEPGQNPVFHILLLLFATVSLPILALSSTSPLLQTWISKIKTKKSPYKLYALSNAGSLIALLSFPFILEPNIGIQQQSDLWAMTFMIFSLLCAIAGFFVWKNKNNKTSPSKSKKPIKLKFKTQVYLLGLAACTSTLLLAVTEKISQDISVVPFFWILPLSLYLLTFIFAFGRKDKNSWSSADSLLYLVIIAIIGLGFFISTDFIIIQVLVYTLILFLFCMICHNEMVRIKPAAKYLTNFYLLIAAGSIIGSIFTGIIAPLVFNSYFELNLIIAVCLFLAVSAFLKSKNIKIQVKKPKSDIIQFLFVRKNKSKNFQFKYNNFIVVSLLILLASVSAGGMVCAHGISSSKILEKSRNFYGTLTIKEHLLTENEKMMFIASGRVLHGSQFISPDYQKLPTTYYGHDSGIGRLFDYYKNKKIKVGAVGLGAGTIAAYGKSGDYFKFYEINPEVKKLCEKYFTYLKDSSAEIKIKLGDARLAMERESPQNYDILIIDAFTGDSIPVHLLTAEAFEIYLKNLKKNSVLAVHISNIHLDLRAPVLKLAKHFKLKSKIIVSPEIISQNTLHTTWILMSENEKMLQSIKSAEINKINIQNFNLWTDDYSNIFEILK
jgi:hypothetical protein